MLVHLARVLDLPLRERNALVQAGGFAPIHPESEFGSDHFAAMRSVLDQLLACHDPYPALVIDRHHNVVAANTAALGLVALIAPDSAALGDPMNIVTMVVHPEGLWSHLEAPESLAAVLATRLVQDAARFPDDAAIAELRDQAIAAAGDAYQVDDPAELAITMRLRIGEQVLSFFTLLTTVGGALDVTADELTVELYYPADASTEGFLRG